MSLQHVTPARDGDVAILTPENVGRRNAVSLRMQESMCRVLAEVPQMEGVRALLLTGAGDPASCAGADLAGGLPGSDPAVPTRGAATRKADRPGSEEGVRAILGKREPDFGPAGVEYSGVRRKG